jgi:hypothetical protein
VGIDELVEQWRCRAQDCREVAAEGAARAFEIAATELENRIAERLDGELTPTEGALLVGRSVSALEKKCRQGRLPNRGKKGQPRFSIRDLGNAFPPRAVARADRAAYNVETDARLLLDARRGGR